MDGISHHSHALADKVYSRFLGRYRLLRFLYMYFRANQRPEGQVGVPWSHFMRSNTVILSRWRALATMIPFSGRLLPQTMLSVGNTKLKLSQDDT